jgi:hypothetical protein
MDDVKTKADELKTQKEFCMKKDLFVMSAVCCVALLLADCASAAPSRWGTAQADGGLVITNYN